MRRLPTILVIVLVSFAATFAAMNLGRGVRWVAVALEDVRVPHDEPASRELPEAVPESVVVSTDAVTVGAAMATPAHGPKQGHRHKRPRPVRP